MKRPRRSFAFAGALALFYLTACGVNWPTRWLAGNQREIDEATQAIAAARDDAERALGYSARGRAYAERARYSRTMQAISAEEAGRLFDLGMQDHDRAVALAPGDARVYLDRALSLFFRASFEDPADPKARALLASAAADFSAVIDRDARNEQAIDMRGIVHLQMSEFDRAIDDFTREMAINARVGRMRLADAYCRRAGSHQQENRTELAIADYEKAIHIGVPADSCECQPDSPLAYLYFETKRYDKSWEVVHRARKSRRWIMPELIDQLERASGKTAG